MTKQIITHLSGFLIVALGIVGIITVRLGAAPLDAYNYFVYVLMPDGITLGTVNIMTGLIVAGIVTIIEKKKQIIISMLFLLSIGVFIDLWKWLVEMMPQTLFEPLAVRLVIAAISLLMIGFGASLTLVSGLPPSPFEVLMMIINRRVNSMMVSKIMIEGTFFMLALILGLLSGRLSEQVNLFTMILVFTIGPMIQYFTGMITKLRNRSVLI
ncbi:MAG: hypothetical protein K9K93_02985 [Acholeplasmataceae bacterium]|nr:hypothetical protein [Acholeplasmataceae bacterium]